MTYKPKTSKEGSNINEVIVGYLNPSKNESIIIK